MAGSSYKLTKELSELRDSCISCVLKHLGQALVLMQEVRQGYPKHHWIAVGHLGEAADEAIKEFPKLAAEIRKHRVKYMADPAYSVPVLDLIEKAKKHMKHEAKMTKKGQEFVSDEISHLMKEGPSKGPQKGEEMPQKQAIAVALDVARRKGFKSPPSPKDESVERRFRLIPEEGEYQQRTAVTLYKPRKYKSLDAPRQRTTTALLPKPPKPKTDENTPHEEQVTMSIFDSIVEGTTDKSIFDDIVESSKPAKSMFDDIVESSDVKTEPSNWDDQVARTLALTEELVDLRNSTNTQ